MASSQENAGSIGPKTTQVLLSLTTAPLLLGLVAARATAAGLQELGRWSEEVFRGDRLPLLDLSVPSAPPANSPESD